MDVLDSPSGFVRKGVCQADMKGVEQAVERQQRSTDKLEETTGRLEKTTSKLNTDLVRVMAEANGVEKAETSQTNIESLKARKQRFWLGVISLALTILLAAVSATLWLSRNNTKPIVVFAEDEAAAEKVVKAINGD